MDLPLQQKKGLPRGRPSEIQRLQVLYYSLPNGDLPWLFTMALRINMLLPRDNACCMTVLDIYCAPIISRFGQTVKGKAGSCTPGQIS